MKHDTLPETLGADAKSTLDQLENRVQGRLCGSIRNFRLDLYDSGLVLRGFAPTYHAKQLAEHVVMTETDLPILANGIEIRSIPSIYGIGGTGIEAPIDRQQPARDTSRLVLSRKEDEQLVLRLGDQTVVIQVLSVGRDRVRIGIIADPSVAVHCEEVARPIQEWQKDLDELPADAAAQS
jgi:carbon storage regulator CsrA